ncbi:MAG: helix-turn-helix domain-containing protein [Candidatus Thorarchaeota archaeon]
MSDDVVTKSVLILRENFDLTEAEVKTIVPIYLGGNMTAGGIALLSGAKISSVKRTLGRLVQKGLVKEIDGQVPVYRAVSPSMALSGPLTDAIGAIEGLTADTGKVFTSRLKEIDAVVNDMEKSQSTAEDDIKTALSTYENEILELVKTQIDLVVAASTGAMTSFSIEIEEAMNRLDSTMDDNLGIKLSELQSEIDKAQLTLAKDLKKVAREFDRWMKLERKGTITSVSEFELRSKALVDATKKAITGALSKSNASIQKLARSLSGTLTSLSSNASDEGHAVLHGVSTEISQFLTNLDGELGKAYLAGQESLKDVVTQSRELSKDYGEFAKNKINTAVEITSSVRDVVDEWQVEVSGFMEVASQSITSQLNQVSNTGTNYLDVVKKSLTSHIDQVNESLNEEYGSLMTLATSLGTECETTLGETRTMILDLLKKENESEITSCDVMTKQLHGALDKWVGSTVSQIETKLTETAEDVSSILNTETSELNTIAVAMNSRLKSAFQSVIKSTSTKNDAMITSVKKTSHDFERDVGVEIDELIANFTSATEKQVRESKDLYEGLRDKLDARMTKSVNTINNQADRIQKEIGNAIIEQVERIEQHSQGIRNEFHTRIEEMTSQFMTMVQGLEVTFNGLLSSQTVEARDIISSAHTEFRTSLKNEVMNLKEDSMKVQQEYSTELALKIDEVASSVETAKKVLEELSVHKRTEISKSMAKTLSDLESAVKSTEQNLRDLESGTVKQFIENMEQVSQEFNVTVDGARDNVSERLDNIRADIEAVLSKSSSQAKTIADGFISDQKDHLQRGLANTSKKITRLATKQVKASAASIEAFQASVAANQTSSMKDRSAAKDEVLATLETRRSEVANAFDAAQVWVDSTQSNMATSLSAHGNKLKNELILMQKGLQKTATEASLAIQEHGDEYVNQFKEITLALFQNTESIVTDRLNDFGESISNALTKSNEVFSNIPLQMEEELSKMEAEITEKTEKDYSEVVRALSATFTETSRAAEAASEELKGLVDSTSIKMTGKRDEVIDIVKKNADLANQHASRKFESIGLELKTKLSSDSTQVVEKARSTFTAKNLEITDSVTKATNTTSEKTSALKQIRNEAISSWNEQGERGLRRWSADQKEQMGLLKDRIQETFNGVTESTQGMIEVLAAIHDLGDEMLAGPSERTWYLSGNDEACAHILDMAQRAKDSVIISLTNPSCIDFKKLAKVKKPKRRVLVIPELDDQVTDIELLDGWRVWQTKTPMLLSVIDDKEMLVGGATDTEALLAIVSEDKTYLQLYHDVLGPRLVSERVV